MSAWKVSGAALAAAVAGVAPGVVGATPVEPSTLAQAADIRAEADSRYRSLPGRKLSVTEATGTDVFGTYMLLSSLFESPRAVSGGNGVYYALCPREGSCPYPALGVAWAADAWLPRRLALELALRTFRETAAALVIVALPTSRPVWFVAEREQILLQARDPALAGLPEGDPSAADTGTRDLVERLTRPRLFVPVASLPPTRKTIMAVHLQDPVPPALRIVAARAARRQGVSTVRVTVATADDLGGEVSYAVTVSAGRRVLATRSGTSAGASTLTLRVRSARAGALQVRVVAWDAAGNAAYATRAVRPR
jgi:hypothetical protein